MQKKLIALAVAGLFATPAFAATSNVDISGTLNFSLDYLDADTDSQDGNWNVSSNASNIIFKGSEDLGGGMKAVWQIQTFFSAGATGNTDTSFGGNGDGVGSGATFVGLSSGFGTVLLGKNESPVKLLSRKVDFFGNQIGDSRNLTTKAHGAGTNSLGFDLRPNNTISYTSPDFSGFSVTGAYFTNMDADTASSSAADYSTDGYSLAANYSNGPLYVGLGFEQHNQSEWWSAMDDEHIWRLAVAYNFGAFRVAGLYQKEDNLYISGNDNVDRTVWGLGASYTMGNMTFKGQYYNANDAASSDTGADLWAVGMDYALSKRTKLQFAYAETDNDDNAKYSAFGGGHGDNPSTGSGGNPSGFSVGVLHAF